MTCLILMWLNVYAMTCPLKFSGIVPEEYVIDAGYLCKFRKFRLKDTACINQIVKLLPLI